MAVVATSSSFSFKEMSGQQRILRLNGRALPYRPFRTVVRQRHDATMLPGYSRASLTLLGPEDPPTEIRGKWKDKYISPNEAAATEGTVIQRAVDTVDNAIGTVGAFANFGTPSQFATNETIPAEFEGDRVRTVKDLCKIIDTWCREGRLLEVSWDAIAYHGIIEEFETMWDNVHDVGWEIRFRWVSRAENAVAPILSDTLSANDTVSLFQQLSDRIGLEALPPTFPMATDVFRDMNALILRIGATVKAAADTVQNVANLIMAPANAVRQLIALTNAVESICTDLVANLQLTFVSGGQYPTYTNIDPAVGLRGSTSPALSQAITPRTFPERMVVAEYTNRVSSVTKELMREAVRASREFTSQLERDLVSVYTARAGEDLRAVSQRFYNTPHEWRRIFSFNELTSTDLRPNQVLLIPRVTTAEGC